MAVREQIHLSVDDQAVGYTPVRVLEIELAGPLPAILAFDEEKGGSYQRAYCLIRLHTKPLGLIELNIDADELRPDAYVQKIWQSLQLQINEHLRQDGLSPVTMLTAQGLPAIGTPACIDEREQFLAHAPFVSVIVPTHDRPGPLAACLASLLCLDYPRYEVIVVDNAPSSSATEELVLNLSDHAPSLRYVREDRPGPSWARNRGIKVAGGAILAFTDDDVIVDAYWLVDLVRGFAAAEHVACVTGLVLPMELETPAQFLFEEFGGFNKGFTRHVFRRDMADVYPKLPLHPYVSGRFGTGASMAFTADFLHEVGGFDPALGGNGPSRNGQDIAVFFEVMVRGYTLVYEPASLLYHLHRREYSALCKQIYNYGVGLTALLTKAVLNNPLRLFDLLAKVPYGLFFLLSARSPKNRKRSERYPEELILLERKGMLYGPLAYLQSRWGVWKGARRAV